MIPIDILATRSIHTACGKVLKTVFSPLIESIASSQNGMQPAGGQVKGTWTVTDATYRMPSIRQWISSEPLLSKPGRKLSLGI